MVPGIFKCTGKAGLPLCLIHVAKACCVTASQSRRTKGLEHDPAVHRCLFFPVELDPSNQRFVAQSDEFSGLGNRLAIVRRG